MLRFNNYGWFKKLKIFTWRNFYFDSKNIAYITVKFVADETNVLFDEDEKPLSGHPDHVTETVDIWTFGRNIKSHDPSWLVYRTNDEDSGEEDHKTVPDSK